MQLIRAQQGDLADMAALYDAVHDALERGVNHPGWRRGRYPTPEVAEEAIAAGTLYLLRAADGRIAASGVLNHQQPAAYAQAAWRVQAPPERVAVVHTLAVHPAMARCGHGARLLCALHEEARAQGCLCMRLDTYAKNLPAQAFYEKLGYTRAGLVDLGMRAYGLDWFQCYELALVSQEA